MSKIPGMDCKAYISASLIAALGAAGVSAVSAWSVMGNVTDVTQNLETDEADITTRENNGFHASMPTLKNATIEFESFWDTEDANFQILFNAWLNKTPIAGAFLSGLMATEGSNGLASNFVVTNCSRSEPLAEGVKASFTLKPYSFTQWYDAPGA